MKSQELRIGNWYRWNEFASMGIGEHQITHGQQIMDYIALKEGVPLTEEWLIRFGFKPYENIGSRRFYHIETFIVEVGVPAAPVYYTSSRELICFIEHVHQLQNLFYALTGEELTPKDHE